jgi:hypothetical protein
MHHQPTWEKILPVGLSEKYQVNKTNGFDANTVDLPPQVSPSLTQLREDKTQILAKMSSERLLLDAQFVRVRRGYQRRDDLALVSLLLNASFLACI